MEIELLDEDVRLWSSGKEANIRLLLSTLHHVRYLTWVLLLLTQLSSVRIWLKSESHLKVVINNRLVGWKSDSVA